jgi:hypothetical protein
MFHKFSGGTNMGIIDKEKMEDLVSNLVKLKFLEIEKKELKEKLLEAQSSVNKIQRAVDYVQESINEKQKFIERIFKYEVKK